MLKQEIRDKIDEMMCEMQIELWNTYQTQIDGDDYIYTIDFDFNEICCDMSPFEIAENVSNGDFNILDDYFIITPYGFNSFPVWNTEEHVDIDTLVNWIMEDEKLESLL